MPEIIALGIVLEGFSTEPAGVVADSKPMKPHKVNNVTLARIDVFDMLETLWSIIKLLLSKKHKAISGIINRGMNFSKVKNSSALPAALTPLRFKSVISKSNIISKAKYTNGERGPMNTLKDPIAVTITAVVLTHDITQ